MRWISWRDQDVSRSESSHSDVAVPAGLPCACHSRATKSASLVCDPALATAQGLKLFHFSAQRKHFLWDALSDFTLFQ